MTNTPEHTVAADHIDAVDQQEPYGRLTRDYRDFEIRGGSDGVGYLARMRRPDKPGSYLGQWVDATTLDGLAVEMDAVRTRQGAPADL